MNSEQTKTYIAFLALGIAVLSIIGLFFIDIPDKNRDLVNIALGSIIGWGGAVVSFYFGNSDQNSKSGDKQ